MCRPLILALAGLSVGVCAQERVYRISIGSQSALVSTGAIWLYGYSWYGLEKIKLAQIEDGRAHLSADPESVKRKLHPHPDTEAYVVAIQTGENMWHRTPNISPDSIWSTLRSALHTLGQVTETPAGEVRLVLPATPGRRITLLYPDGRPVIGAKVDVSVFLYNRNHCAHHQGLPLGTFQTDQNGSITVAAPPVPLFLDAAYFEDAGKGPVGAALSYNFGLQLGTQESIVLKKRWELSPDDSLLDEFELRVSTPRGAPMREVEVATTVRTNTCGGGGRVGKTDARGTARFEVIPEIVQSMTLSLANGETRELKENELRELFSRGKAAIRW